MTADEMPQVTLADAQSVSRKLEDLHATLAPNERVVLETVLGVFQQRAGEADVQDLLKDFPDAPELLEDVAGFRLRADQEPVRFTDTITTAVTVAKSKPWGCDLKAAD